MKPVTIFLLCLACLPAWSATLTQQQLSAFTQAAQLRFGVASNLNEGGPRIKLVLNNQSDIALPAGKSDWVLYFHSVRKIATKTEAGLELSHVQGDLHQLQPVADFAGLKAGDQLSFSYHPSAAMVSTTDFMPRAFLVVPGLTPAVFANTDTEDVASFTEPFTRIEQQKRSAADQYSVATAASRYEKFAAVSEIKTDAVSRRIVPAPESVKYGRGTLQLDNSWTLVYAGGLATEADYLQARLAAEFGLDLARQPDHLPAEGKVLVLSVAAADKKLALPEAAESYTLKVDKERIVINGRDSAGAFYGIQSLLNVMPGAVGSKPEIPLMTVTDSPRAEWRGMHYDMGRNFHGKDVTLRLIEQMARYKLNKLHLHLTEDEGWRIEIPGLPELTEVGAFRCFDLDETRCLLTQLGTGPDRSGSGNGFYSVQDFVEILKFAAARHIDVIPEVDMPGHARAAIKSMDARYKKLKAAGDLAAAERYLLADPADTSEYITVQNYTDNSVNVCLPSTYQFIDKVVYELQQMYRKAGLKLSTFHMGGDEVGAGSWTASPACQALFATEEGVAGPADLKPYFVSRVAAITGQRGLNLAGWEDGLMYDPSNTFNRDQFANQHVMANVWDNIWEWGVADRSHRLANDGYEVILSHGTHLYFDHPYEPHPAERGYYWASRFTDVAKVFGYMPDNLYANADVTRNGVPIDNLEALLGRPLPALKKPENILGMQGQVWSETIRTADQLETMIYPRLLPLAERAWHKAGWEGDNPDAAARLRDYAGFTSALVQKELPRMVAAGLNIHLLPPGALRKDGQLLANAAWPGLSIEYRQGAGGAWQRYDGPVAVGDAAVELRTRLGGQTSRTTPLQ